MAISDDVILKHFEHTAVDTERYNEIIHVITDIREEQKRQADTLKPIAETYTTTSTLGRWMMAVLVGVSMIVGTVWGIVQIIIHR